MTTYTFVASERLKEKPETQQDTFNTYYWGGVIALLVITSVVLFVMYGLETASTSHLQENVSSQDDPVSVLKQLPLYLGSTQFADPPGSV